jgi:predicted RND superfamily exporter protein
MRDERSPRASRPGTVSYDPLAAPTRLESLFRAIVARRRRIVLVYVFLAVPAAWLTARIPEENAVERMLVDSDPDVVATREFRKLFPEKESILLLAESADPLSPASTAAVLALERAVARVAGASPISALTIAEHLRPGITSPGRQGELRPFLAGTPFFRRQCLLGDDFLGIAVDLDTSEPKQRDRTLADIEAAVRGAEASSHGTLVRVRRVGEPFMNAYLARETAEASRLYLPLFGVFVVVLNFSLYRSWRALAAILSTLGTCVLLGTATAGLFGFSTSIISSLVPLMLMVTATASLVYIHSRFVDRPPDRDVDEHQAHALANKFPPVTASIFAAAVGFAALGVSQIRPIREMGLWTAAGLLVTWLCCFSLFPSLQKLLRAPTRQERALAGHWVVHSAETIPPWSYRWRWPLVASALALAASGAVALFGLPGLLRGMPMETDQIHYIPASAPVAEDARFFESRVAGLKPVSLWITSDRVSVLDPGFLAGLDGYASAIERDPRILSVTGLPAILRLRRYAAGQGDVLPRGDALTAAAADLEELLLQEPALRAWVDMRSLRGTRLTVLTAPGRRVEIAEIGPALLRLWEVTARETPALAGSRMRVVGQGLLSEKISDHLVPTVVHSFALTAAVIFVAFFLVFRSGAARLLAMIPSLFAVLVMFLVMRVLSIPLNVATILIATTVLGATENDQIHFFWHLQERRSRGHTHEALAHAIRVAGSAIFFATVVNAGGFLALALADLPPMRQFGVLTATAFALSMLADFTALPAALWIVFRERPLPPAAVPQTGRDAPA